MGRLWKQFKREVNDAISTNTSSSRADMTTSRRVCGETQRTTPEWSLSPDQMENLLRNECQQRLGPSSSSNGKETSRQQEIENGIDHVLQNHPELPSGHFLRFLHCLDSKERVGAIDALHAYSDYVLIRRRRQRRYPISNPFQPPPRSSGGHHHHHHHQDDRQTNNNNTNSNMAVEHQQILQFAAILLAALHYETGDIALARLATDEAVRVAQQQQQRVSVSNNSGGTSRGGNCVAYSLGWLSQTASAASLGLEDANDGSNTRPPNIGDAREWMIRCAERSAESNLRSLTAGAFLSRVKQTLEQSSFVANAMLGDVSTPGRNSNDGMSGLPLSPFLIAQSAWSLLYAAATTESTETAAASTHFIPPNDRPMHMTYIHHGDTALSILSQQRVMTAAIWDAYNQSASSGFASLLALLLSSSGSLSSLMSSLNSAQVPKTSTKLRGTKKCLLSYNHIAAAIQNVSRTAVYGSKQRVLLGLPKDSESKSTVRKLHVSGVHYQCTCIYGDALIQMSRLRKAYGIHIDNVAFLQEMALILHEWAVRRGDLLDAQALMRFLLSNIHPGMANYAQIQIDARIQQSLLQVAQKDWDRAKQILKEQLHRSKSAGLPIHTAWILLRLAHLLITSSSVTNALPYLFQCLSMCDEQGMDGLHAVAVSVLAQVHIKMLRYDSAITIIEAALPKILQQGHVWFQAEAFLSLAKAHLLRGKSLPVQGKLSMAANDPCCGKSKQKQRLRFQFELQMAMRALSKSLDLFESCQDGNKLKEVYFLKASILNMIQNSSIEREQAAKKFMALSRYLGYAFYAKSLTNVFQNVLLLCDDDLEIVKLASRKYV